MIPKKADAISALVSGPITAATDGSYVVYHDGQTPPTEEAILAKFEELKTAYPMKLLREERNRRLAETDYLALKDVFMTTDEELYRQQLRDITKGAKPKLDENGNLTNITWPVRPK